MSCFESKERLPPTKKKEKKISLSRLRHDDNRKGPPHIKVDRSTSSSNNARDFDDFDFDAEEEEEEETRKKKKRDLSVFLSFQQKRLVIKVVLFFFFVEDFLHLL